MIPQVGASADIAVGQNEAVGLAQADRSTATGAETVRAVEPPKEVLETPLIPPDPDPPVGPPPAFEATLLDQARDDFPETGEENEDPYDVPPSATEKMTTSLQRIETPYDTATVDISR